MWIDYTREGWAIEEKRNTPIKRITAVWFYWANMENWDREPGTSWYTIGTSTYRTATMTREQFIERFSVVGEEEGERNFTSGDRLGGLD